MYATETTGSLIETDTRIILTVCTNKKFQQGKERSKAEQLKKEAVSVIHARDQCGMHGVVEVRSGLIYEWDSIKNPTNVNSFDLKTAFEGGIITVFREEGTKAHRE